MITCSVAGASNRAAEGLGLNLRSKWATLPARRDAALWTEAAVGAAQALPRQEQRISCLRGNARIASDH